MILDKDAFSSGQIQSKLWLCRELETLFDQIDTIYIYGGWYAVSAFLLLSREKIKIKKISSYDIDPACQATADLLNENWLINDWQFKAHTQDCNSIRPKLNEVDLIINTSTEHFTSMKWWSNIPKGVIVALQGNNMNHEDHHIHSTNLEKFKQHYPLTNYLYEGQLDIAYPDWSFSRYMIIGQK